MARGGQRRGTPGTAYANRTDMHQPVKTPDGMAYGKRKMLEEAQKVIPLPTQPSMPGPATGGGGPAVAPTPPMSAQPGLSPGELDFARPTERPAEPVTAGLPVGPGPGPEALGLGPTADDPAVVLRSMYANVPEARNNDVLRLIEALDNQ